jgi:anti-sigma regulatory factor (Ser/Thr protein kinase)
VPDAAGSAQAPAAPRRISLDFPATLQGFEGAFGTLQQELRGGEMHPGTRYNVELVFEEIVANIVRHGSGCDDGHAVGASSGVDVKVGVDVDASTVVLTFDDGGVAFNPLLAPDPRRPTTIEDTPIGGLGLMMVRRAALDLRYERTPEERNRLTVILPAVPKTAAGRQGEGNQ